MQYTIRQSHVPGDQLATAEIESILREGATWIKHSQGCIERGTGEGFITYIHAIYRHICSIQAARQYMICEYESQAIFIEFRKIARVRYAAFVESLVDGCQHCKRTFTCEVSCEAGVLQCGIEETELVVILNKVCCGTRVCRLFR